MMNQTPSPFTVRLARLEDLPHLTRLCVQLGYPSSQAEVLARLDEITSRPDQAVFVAELENGAVAGWAHALRLMFLETDAFVELAGLVVDENQRGMGLGHALLGAVEGWAREQGIGMVRLRSNTIRVQAHEFYRKAGYTAIKTQTAFAKQVL